MKKKVLTTIARVAIIAVVIASIALAVYFILRACGLTTAEDFKRLRNELGDSAVFWLIIAILQVVQVIFIPVSNQIITVPLAVIFPVEDLWKVWLTSWLSIWLATLILYVIGRCAGARVLAWVLKDKEQSEKCSAFLNKGWIFYPLGMLLPLPDDIITILAGTAKMNFAFVAISSLLTRAIDVSCSVWGIGYLTRYWWGWIILGLGILGLGIGTFIFWRKQKMAKCEKGCYNCKHEYMNCINENICSSCRLLDSGVELTNTREGCSHWEKKDGKDR